MPERTALLVGATGLIGTHCLDLLLADPAYAAVATLGRRPLARTHARLTHHVVDFDRLAAHADLVRGDDVFCCLGTTMKQAGSEAAFRRVDHDYPLQVATLAAANGAQQYLLVSAMGADAGSRVFYNRVKGEVEAAVSAQPFDGVYLFRPSLLTGDRAERRLGERLAEVVLEGLAFLLRGPLRPYRAIAAADVAQAMVAVARQQPGGRQVYPSDQIQALADAAGNKMGTGDQKGHA